MRLYLFNKTIKSLYFCSSVVSLLFMRFHFKLGHAKIALSTAMISYSRLLAVIYQLNDIYRISNFRLHFIHSAQAGYEEFARESKPIRILSLSTVPSNTRLSTASFLNILYIIYFVDKCYRKLSCKSKIISVKTQNIPRSKIMNMS